MSKNATFIILDVSPAMLNLEEGYSSSSGINLDANSYFFRAKNIAETLLKRKLLANRKQDYVGLIFAGVDNNEHPFGRVLEGQLALISPLAQAALPMAKAIISQDVSTQSCDGLAAVECALDMIGSHCKKQAYRAKTIIFLTCPQSNPPKDNERERIAQIWDKIKEVGALLAYVGCSGVSPEPGKPGFEDLPLLHQLAAQGGGQALNYDEGQMLAIEALISSDVKLTPCLYGELFVADKLGISTLGYLQSRTSAPFGFKDCDLEDCSIKASLARASSTQFSVLEPTSTEVVSDDTQEVKVQYRYGSVDVPKDLLDSCTQHNIFGISKAIRVLGFIPREKVNRLHFMEEPMILQPRFHPEAFETLAISIHRSKKVGIAWYLRTDVASQITIGYLVPCRATTSTAAYFQFFRIPFAQDIHTSLLPSLNGVPLFLRSSDKIDELQLPRPSKLQKPLFDAAEEFINAMMLPLKGQDVQDYNPYKPISLPNPGWMGIINAIHARATDQPIPSGPDPLMWPELPASCLPVVNNLKRSFLALTGENES